MSQLTKSEIWVHFASAALSSNRESSVSHVAKLADDLFDEYEKRYGDKALIIRGITSCYVCQKPIGDNFLLSDGLDGEFKKFCAECVEQHKKGDVDNNPRIAQCVKCGQQKGTIFKCPEGSPPIQLTEEMASTLSATEISLIVSKEQDYRNKLTSGPEHTFP